LRSFARALLNNTLRMLNTSIANGDNKAAFGLETIVILMK